MINLTSKQKNIVNYVEIILDIGIIICNCASIFLYRKRRRRNSFLRNKRRFLT